MIEPVISGGASESRRNLLSGTYLGKGRRAVALVTCRGLLRRAAGGISFGKPLMTSVGHDDSAIGELNLITRPSLQHLSNCQYPRGPPVRAQQLVTDGDR